MGQSSVQIRDRNRPNLLLFVIFLATVFLFGGASRGDVVAQPVVRVAAILIVLVAATRLRREDWRRIRPLLLFIGGFAAIIAFQLVPLPPGLWASLPGRSTFAHDLATVDLASVWRPISMTPDLTLNSLLALLPPLAVVIALGAVQPSSYGALVSVILGGIVFSAVLGLVQIGSGEGYLYQITNQGSAVGLFANRNHQAALLACSMPLLACWVRLPHPDPAYRRVRVWIALCFASAVFPFLLITGSRAGLLLGILGALMGLAISMRGHRQQVRQRLSLQQLAMGALPVIIGIAAIAASTMLSRDLAVQRILVGSQADARTAQLPTYVDMIHDFFPIGSGFSSFDRIYRSYESYETLGPSYLNHAHNDLAEIAIEGGAAALVLVVAFLLWFTLGSWRAWRKASMSIDGLVKRTGASVGLLLLLASLVDYPLRTPLMSALMAIVCIWLLPAGNAGADASAGRGMSSSHPEERGKDTSGE